MALEVRRIVTGHDANGKAVVETDERLAAVPRLGRPHIAGCEIWSTNKMPVDNTSEEGEVAQRAGFVKRYNYVGSGQGTVIRITEFAPGAPKFTHRTETIDYALLLSGECDLELDGGEVLHMKPGDIVVQRGTMHAWVNNGSSPAVFAFILIDAEPARVGGQELRTDFPASRTGCRLRLDEIEPSFDPVEPVVHAIEPQAHLRDLACHVRDAALDRAKATSLLSLLLADLVQLCPDREEMFENRIGGLCAHCDYCVRGAAALQYWSASGPNGRPHMEFGMFHQFPALPGRTQKEAFAEGFEQIEAAERWGLDAMWLAELHFDPQRSVLSAPLSMAAAVGARTERIKIGIAVQVLPLCHPLRLAEEAATVDHISGGRLIFGVGRSGLPRTYEDYGVSYAESRDRFAEVLDIIELAWSQPDFSYEGRYYNFKNITVAPEPLQKPYPPIRIAAASPDTYPAVGEKGLPIFINARYGSFSEFAPEIRAYREAYRAAGHEGRGQVYLRVPAYLAETPERAREEPRESLMHFYREQAQRLRDSLSRAGTRAIEGRAERLKRIENLTYEEALQGQVLVGTPDEVAERLRSLQDELGIDGILAEINCGGLVPHRQVMTALQLLCQEVKPRFH